MKQSYSLKKPDKIDEDVVESARFTKKDFPGGSDGKESAYNIGDQIWPVGWEDSLEKRMAPHSSIFTWRIP